MSNPLKKTMMYLGLADEELEYEEQAQQPSAPASPAQATTSAQQAAPHRAAPVTPLRRPAAVKQAAPTELSEILTVHPKQYRDAQSIAESFRDGIPVIINLSQMSDGDARRLIDFASGLSQGLYGKIERVTAKVFLLSPAHVSISGENDSKAEADATFFAQQ
ncbi:cell division protein SepF [Microbacterium sp. MPKO10]|uniref:cell division protein SepF n=1 Tax=Microbacterium sp. MPKO10 TaxID=2989818 RepID=UPI0022362DEC|nr:cell division protein SepF [Microbacterium sp. MPKO10]MCW4459409.1 cell division protein SepF [Microbacterium sp. MPKO10]